VDKRTISTTAAKVSPAAPPLCSTAISNGHWKKMVVRPVNNCATSSASISVAGPRRPGSARSRQASVPRYRNTTKAKLRCTQWIAVNAGCEIISPEGSSPRPRITE